jgi:hypothetical protein
LSDGLAVVDDKNPLWHSSGHPYVGFSCIGSRAGIGQRMNGPPSTT